ncbi:MFS transporter [Nocardioides insulae]|uniref:MFS transporter n=1 Tax=Nocardioides insulae TaxID=394734 RepID=UPI0003F4FAFA|nr:MFS transporter [Nocardioides insulae]
MITTPNRGRLPATVGFVVASVALVLVFVSAGTPIPLYNTYRVEDALTDADFSLVTAVYLGCAAISLLFLGRLSDHLGRRPVAVVALLSSALGVGCMLAVDSVGPLLLGRVFQGLACGMASSALGALVIDSAPPHPRWLSAVITSAAPALGIPFGAMMTGVLADFAPDPTHLTYTIVLVLLVGSAVGIALGPETVARTTLGRAAASLRPRIVVPAGTGRRMTAMAGLILATWSVGGFYQAFGPSIASAHLGSDDVLVAAAVFGSFTVLNLLGGPITARLMPATAVRLGALTYLACVAGILASLSAGAIVPFLVISLVCGITQGIGQTGGMRSLLPDTSPGDRAGLLATVFLVNYASAAVPSFVAGRFAGHVPLMAIALGYGVLALVGVTVAVALTGNPVNRPVLTRGAPVRAESVTDR